MYETVLYDERLMHKYLVHVEKKKQNNFLWRFQQKVNEFKGAISDVMLFSLIYFNFDISPHRYC